MTTYAIRGGVSGELISYGGQVLVHANKTELQWLFPHAEVVEIRPDAWPTMPVKDHPDMQTVRWPLRKEDFV
jgi:hypothetical protein